MSDLLNFEIGDTVKLKSGGPTMTIDARIETDQFLYPGKDFFMCVWFEGETRNRGGFHKDTLVKITP